MRLDSAQAGLFVAPAPIAVRLPPRTTRPRRPRGWLVIVARDEDEIHAKLRRVLATDRHTRVIFDRRANGARNHPWVARSLRIHGFAVVPAAGGKERTRQTVLHGGEHVGASA
jgi:hypothetical protein